MKVNRPSINKSTIFNLIGGTVFYYNTEYYLKTDGYDVEEQACTCTRITDGKLVQLRDTMVVEYYDAEVTIK